MWGKRSKQCRIKRHGTPSQSSSRGPVACFWSTNRKQNILLWAPKKLGAHRHLMSNPALDLKASASEVRPFIPTDSEQNKGDDSEKGDNEEVQSNNESNRDRESEEDKD
ncbi:hypothetical protein NPIL_6391 [Nephila pilipes]|uniref:Uncharacterized protein n=1 Tax=Nephila pilipes TaxID=299642 RepID=A0A8X6UD65_NEPPI|nr:hypothetical protein NPIL_6391 [Nephila pilipes]